MTMYALFSFLWCLCVTCNTDQLLEVDIILLVRVQRSTMGPIEGQLSIKHALNINMSTQFHT